MSPRGPNQSQRWFCKECAQVTVHRIPDLDSDWTGLDDIRVFKRWRQCTKCYSNLRTYEITADQLDRMLSDLDQLRALKSDHRRLLAAIEAKRKAEAEIDNLVPEEVRTVEVDAEST